MAVVVGINRGPAQPMRVMPLGDSITDGYNVPGGYRIGLWQRLAAGRSHTSTSSARGFNGPAGLGDHDHEGHSGWRIDQLDANIVGWLQTLPAPRTVLLHIGTNDVTQNYRRRQRPRRASSALIDKIRRRSARRSSCRGRVRSSRSGPDAGGAASHTYNAAIPAWSTVARRRAARPPSSTCTPRSPTPTSPIGHAPRRRAGYDKMADAWYPVVQAMYDRL